MTAEFMGLAGYNWAVQVGLACFPLPALPWLRRPACVALGLTVSTSSRNQCFP